MLEWSLSIRRNKVNLLFYRSNSNKNTRIRIRYLCELRSYFSLFNFEALVWHCLKKKSPSPSMKLYCTTSCCKIQSKRGLHSTDLLLQLAALSYWVSCHCAARCLTFDSSWQSLRDTIYRSLRNGGIRVLPYQVSTPFLCNVIKERYISTCGEQWHVYHTWILFFGKFDLPTGL